ncbi:ribosomal protein L22e [Absidia repens]|uniref:Ribosomal protein L22e n=1 Tax=Absidia repens TaxID=90262 RepID=A0A1X2IYK7_9FUNG|nr:ribosomal protein L22e [Absidia repens]
MAPVKSTSAASAIKKTKVIVDCSAPANDKIFDVAAFEKYLHDRIKVDGRTNNLGEAIKITRSDNKISIVANIAFSKRYIKYLTKKFLKKNQIRDWLRVISTDKQTFELRYFNIANDEEEADEE